ncbi:MAG TPA: response regulator [Bacteroidia bacterium]|nr:response regulator [Bacteroidia bacterium]
METQVNILHTWLPSKTKTFLGSFLLRLKRTLKNWNGLRTFSRESQKKVRVFLVDDDPLYLKALENSISTNSDSLTINTFQTGEACLQNMKLKPSIVILDYYLNSEIPYAWNGMTILKHIKKINPRAKIIMVSSQDSLNVAIDCMEKGAHDYVSKSRSSFVRINNIIKNITGDIEVNSVFYETCKFVVLIIILVLIATFIMRY